MADIKLSNMWNKIVESMDDYNVEYEDIFKDSKEKKASELFFEDKHIKFYSKYEDDYNLHFLVWDIMTSLYFDVDCSGWDSVKPYYNKAVDNLYIVLKENKTTMDYIIERSVYRTLGELDYSFCL